jgi:hypothetical protein
VTARNVLVKCTHDSSNFARVEANYVRLLNFVSLGLENKANYRKMVNDAFGDRLILS